MQLLKAINEFPIKRIARSVLPDTTALQNACARFERTSKSFEDQKERLTRVLSVFRAGEASSIDRRDIRFIVAAIGSSDLIDANQAKNILGEVERRRDDRLLRSVFGAVLTSYREPALRTLTSSFLKRRVDVLRPNARRFVDRSAILQDDGLLMFGKELACSTSINELCLQCEINTQVLASNYGTELKLAALRQAVKLDQVSSVRQVADWALSGVSGTPIGDFYEAMLSHFKSRPPAADTKKYLMSTLVRKFGDPRLRVWPTLKGKNSDARRESCVATIRQWLSIEYLDLFIKIIEDTAEDRQFKPRKAFWLNYFEKGVISDVTLILASDADRIARKMRDQKEDAEYMQWATLSQAQQNQSVLLMRLGDLIIAEWSHSGAMRFWKAEGKSTPDFHLREYVGPQLRNDSLKIKVGNEYRNSIIHHDNGQWMRWASAAIKHHTGISE